MLYIDLKESKLMLLNRLTLGGFKQCVDTATNTLLKVMGCM